MGCRAGGDPEPHSHSLGIGRRNSSAKKNHTIPQAHESLPGHTPRLPFASTCGNVTNSTATTICSKSDTASGTQGAAGELGQARKGHRHLRAAGGQAAQDTEDARGGPDGQPDPPNLPLLLLCSGTVLTSRPARTGGSSPQRGVAPPPPSLSSPCPHRRVPARGQRWGWGWGWAGRLLEFCSTVARQWRRQTLLLLRQGAAGPNANQGRRSSPGPMLPLPAPPWHCSHPGAEEQGTKAPA